MGNCFLFFCFGNLMFQIHNHLLYVWNVLSSVWLFWNEMFFFRGTRVWHWISKKMLLCPDTVSTLSIHRVCCLSWFIYNSNWSIGCSEMRFENTLTCTCLYIFYIICLDFSTAAWIIFFWFDEKFKTCGEWFYKYSKKNVFVYLTDRKHVQKNDFFGFVIFWYRVWELSYWYGCWWSLTIIVFYSSGANEMSAVSIWTQFSWTIG